MYYITVKQSPRYHQVTMEDLWFGSDIATGMITSNVSNTRTYEVEEISPRVWNSVSYDALVSAISNFNEKYKDLFEADRKSLYYEFYIPKKSGGLRRIDAPNDELMKALNELKDIFEERFGALYHTSSFAYAKKRSTIDAVKRHQSNESKWFAKYDLHDFFGSTTKEFVLASLSKIFPFSKVMVTTRGAEQLSKAIDLAFLNGGLPQGTPISPLITNVMMIPIDYRLFNTLRDYNSQHFVYTRYADDFIISSKYDFDFKKIEKLITDTLKEFGATFELNTKKTRYGSSAGSNWNLGVMLNKDNQITVGHKKKRQLKAMLTSYALDKKSGKDWSLTDVQVLNGHIAYYTKVEGDAIKDIIDKLGAKFEYDIMASIIRDLKSGSSVVEN